MNIVLEKIISFSTDKDTILFLLGVLSTFVGFSAPKVISWCIKKSRIKKEKKYLIMTILEDIDLLSKKYEGRYSEDRSQENAATVTRSVMEQLNYISEVYHQNSFTNKKSQPIRNARQATKMILLTADSMSSRRITSELENKVYNVLDNYLESL